MGRKKKDRPYDKTPTLSAAISPLQAQALGIIAANRSAGGSKVYIADLVGEAVLAAYGPEIEAVIANLKPECPICHLRGGCEHTFTQEI